MELKTLQEAQSFNRLYTHMKPENGWIIMSVFRGERDKNENLSLHEEFKKILKSAGLGYWVIDGVWIENQGTENERHLPELSFFIPFKEGMNPDEFKNFASANGKKYNQDAVLVKLPDGPVELIDKTGGVTEFKGEVGYDKIADIYSRLRKGHHQGRTFTLEGIQKPSGFMSAYLFKVNGQLW